MSCPKKTTYRFRAIEDFAKIEDPAKRLCSALEYGIRVSVSSRFEPRFVRVVNGPLSFRLRVKRMICGEHDSRTLFIREVSVAPNSNIELHYYDIIRQKEYIAEITRHPGINLNMDSGYDPRRSANTIFICTREGGVMIIDENMHRHYVL